MKIECIDKKSEDFPDKLKKLEKCPEQIYIQGNKRILSEFSLAIVGSRKCSILGKTIARDITEELARNNIVISSGLARGIDTVAHTACVENGSKTIAVLGGGHNKIYPVENKNLIKNIIEKEGAVISEYPEFNKYSASVVSSTVTAAKQGVVKNAANNNPNNNSLLIIPILIYLNRMFPL